MFHFDTIVASPSKLDAMKKKLGELLRDRGQVTAENLSKALDEHHQKLVLLGEVLVQGGLVDRANLVAAPPTMPPDLHRKLTDYWG